MTISKFNWRILKTLSNCAFAVVIVIQVLDLYLYFYLDSAIGTPLERVWLSRHHLYDGIGLVAFVLWLIFRISYWTIEYVHDRRRDIANKRN